jgi:twitching motility two-component system response regulator PilH
MPNEPIDPSGATEPCTSADPVSTSLSGAPSSRRALVIDDEPDITRYLAALLADHGWKVRTATRADEGLALARQEPPDVVLLDVMMPERGGLSTLVALRKDQDLRGVPVVFVTGIDATVHSIYDPDQELRTYLKRFRHYRPDAVLEKPVSPERLLEVLDELLADQAPQASAATEDEGAEV